MTLKEELESLLSNCKFGDEQYAVNVVQELLELAIRREASDVHLLPIKNSEKLQPYFRIDGVLEPAVPISGGVNVITRLKVLSNLLTYRTDVPQEGRLKRDVNQSEIRVSTFPTIHGEKAVIRFFVGSGNFKTLSDLGYRPEIENELKTFLQLTSGLLLTCGPAGSGKTTMLYASLRHILEKSPTPRSICTLEDPVEAVLPEISQSAVKPEGEFTYERGLISLMRQDPDVIMVGEIRDPTTAAIVFQASLTGHLVLSTFHSGSAAGALGRLSDMKIEPYIIRSGLTSILAQRLLRKTCDCIRAGESGCEKCRQTGYFGRVVAAELLNVGQPEIAEAILQKRDVHLIAEAAEQSGMVSMQSDAKSLISQGLTNIEECLRIFGPSYGSHV